MKISNIIKRPVVTEKTMEYQEDDKYVFDVSLRASKGAIANEVSRVYGVEVDDVRTMIMPGKKRRIFKTNRFMKTKKWKKAIVKLKDGQKIDLVGK